MPFPFVVVIAPMPCQCVVSMFCVPLVRRSQHRSVGVRTAVVSGKRPPLPRIYFLPIINPTVTFGTLNPTPLLYA